MWGRVGSDWEMLLQGCAHAVSITSNVLSTTPRGHTWVGIHASTIPRGQYQTKCSHFCCIHTLVGHTFPLLLCYKVYILYIHIAVVNFLKCFMLSILDKLKLPMSAIHYKGEFRRYHKIIMSMMMLKYLHLV